MSANFFQEVWNKRSLIILLAINDVKLRYRNSVLGFVWSFLEPLLMLTVLYFVFTNILKSNIENYPLFLLLGLIIWYMFSRSTGMGLSSLIDRASIIQKIYIRKEVIVISSCLTAFIMMAFEFTVFAVFIIVFQFTPPVTIILLPLILVILFFLTVGISLIISVSNVFFRDIQFIWQVLVQAGFFLSPIFYELDIFPENVQAILYLNPVVHILEISRDLTLYGNLPSVESVIYAITFTAVTFVIGIIVFRVKGKKIVEEL